MYGFEFFSSILIQLENKYFYTQYSLLWNQFNSNQINSNWRNENKGKCFENEMKWNEMKYIVRDTTNSLQHAVLEMCFPSCEWS